MLNTGFNYKLFKDEKKMISIIGNVIGKPIYQSSTISFTSEYQVVLDKATLEGYTLPSESEQIDQNALVLALIDAGIWDQLDVFYPMVSNIDFATLNWIDPDSYQLTLVNSPAYSATNGFTGTATAYINTTWRPSVDGTNFTLNEGGIGVYETTNIEEASNTFGTGNSGVNNATNLATRNVGNTLNSRLNSNSSNFISTTNNDSIGRYHVKRIDSVNMSVYKNGSIIVSGAASTSGLSTVALYFLARNNNGSVSSTGTRSAKCLWVGSSLTTLEAALDNILNDFYN